MRAHIAVNDALMNITKGDYARFNDQTYREVYEEIVAIADKKYETEAVAHEQTKKQLENVEKEREQLAGRISDLQAEMDANNEADFNKKCNRYGWFFTILLIGLPYTVIIIVIEILRKQYSGFSFFTMVHLGVLFLSTILAGFLFKKGKHFCFMKCRDYFIKKRISN